MEPLDAYTAIREAILRRPELRFKRWPDLPAGFDPTLLNPYHGFCYVATQVFCHLVEEAKPYSYWRDHFWARIGDEIWDPTSDQFPDGFTHYEEGKPTRFKTLCARAEALLEETLGG